jgi:hypothetical protein
MAARWRIVTDDDRLITTVAFRPKADPGGALSGFGSCP